jgi:branched-chain amino acid transport system substrate-binding protein
MRQNLTQRVLCLLVVPLIGACGGAAQSPGSATPITLGVILPLTGPQADSGQDEKRGYEMALADVNKAGGINGHPVALSYQDNQSVPATAIQAAQALISQKVPVILGEWSSTTTNAVASACQQNNQLCVLSGGSSIGLDTAYGGQPWYWHLLAYGDYYASTAADFIKSLNPQPTSIAIAYSNDAYGQPLAAALQKDLQGSGVRVVYFQSFPSGQSDYTSLITKVKATNPEVFASIAFPPDQIVISSEMRQLNFSPKVSFGTGGIAYPAFQNALGKDSEYMVGVDAWVTTVNYPGNAAWVARFNSLYHQDPTLYAPLNYISLLAYVKAANDAKSTDQAKVEQALANLKMDTIYGPLSFDARHQAFRTTVAFQYQGGKKVVVFPPGAAGGKVVYPVPAWSAR